MKDIPSLLKHPSIAGADRVVLASGQPIVIHANGGKKGLGKPLATQQIGNLLKATLPPDVMTECQWGKSVDYKLSVGEAWWHLHIVLKPERKFLLELKPAEAPQAEAEDEVEEDDAELDDLITLLTQGENLALVYHRDPAVADSLKEVVNTLGFTPKTTTNHRATLEVLKYFDYDLFILHLDEQFQNDPVYKAYKNFTMDLRRTQFSVLVAPKLPSGDQMHAFAHSVNLVVASENQAGLVGLTVKSMATWKRQVEALHRELDAAGRL